MIDVTNFRSHVSGALRGFLEVQYHGLTIRDVVLFEKHGESWTKLPTRRWQSREGQWMEELILSFEDRAAKDEFDRSVLTALEAFQEVRS